jgi:uncharacterized protein DUF3618
MTTPTDPDAPPPAKDAGADEVEADLARTREDLGRTVDVLSAKLDVKAQTRQKMRGARQRAIEQARAARVRGERIVARVRNAATDDQGKVTPTVSLAAATFVAAMTAIFVTWWRRR